MFLKKINYGGYIMKELIPLSKEEEEKVKDICKNVGFTYIGNMRNEYVKYILFICNKHKYKGIQKISISNLKRIRKDKCGCHLRSYTKEDLLRNRNIKSNIEILGEYINNKTKILCRCSICGNEWYATPNKLKQGRGCPQCKIKSASIRNRKTQEDFIKELSNIQPNLIVLGKYNGWNSRVDVLCLDCGSTTNVRAGSLLKNNGGCKQCRSSLGEKKIYEWLNKNNIYSIRQHIFKDCVYVQPLRFDFYLPDHNVVIEYQGEQHYFPVNFRGKGYTGFKDDHEKLLIRDSIKKNYCLEKNITFIEIPYWQKDNIPTILSSLLKHCKNP